MDNLGVITKDPSPMKSGIDTQSAATPKGVASQNSVLEFGDLCRLLWHHRQFDALALALAFVAVPISIAVSEAFLSVALLAHVLRLVRRQASVCVPRIFWFWLAWVALAILSWSSSPDRSAGQSEIKHILLLGALFFVMPALLETMHQVAVWRGIFLAASLGSLFLIGDFISRMIYYQRELSVGGAPGLYLRTGGLLNNWMVFATVEILIFAALLAYARCYPEQHRFWIPVFAINALAITLTLTRMLWLGCFVLLEADLVWRRSRWFWALLLLPVALYFMGPRFIRVRLRESTDPSFYANAERVEMLRVGWKMVKNRPLTGVGPGRIQELYRHYLSPSDPVPAYYGHLHNNLAEIAAEFGLPAAAAAVVLLAVLFSDLRRASKGSVDPGNEFLCRTALFGLAGFILLGAFDYTYGHSLALILLSFVVLAPLVPAPATGVAMTNRCEIDRGTFGQVKKPTSSAER